MWCVVCVCVIVYTQCKSTSGGFQLLPYLCSVCVHPYVCGTLAGACTTGIQLLTWAVFLSSSVCCACACLHEGRRPHVCICGGWVNFCYIYVLHTSFFEKAFHWTKSLARWHPSSPWDPHALCHLCCAPPHSPALWGHSSSCRNTVLAVTTSGYLHWSCTALLRQDRAEWTLEAPTTILPS